MNDLYTVQHQDRNVSRESYNQAIDSQKLRVFSIFYTLQGEGPFAGWPAVFVRLAGCNRGAKAGMGCEFCDTRFAFDAGMELTFDEIAIRCAALVPASYISEDRPVLVVISGGEPMLQNALRGFCQYLFNWRGSVHRFAVQIESNGDRLGAGFHEDEKIRHFDSAERWPYPCLIVSPKAVPSLGGYRSMSSGVFMRADYLKVLIDARKGSLYNLLPAYFDHFVKMKGAQRVYLSPLTVYQRGVQADELASAWGDQVDRLATADNYAYAARLAKAHGVNFSMQQHLFMGLP